MSPVERLGATPTIRYQDHPSEMWHGLERVVYTLHHPHPQSLASVFGQDVHVRQVIDRHHVGDPTGETYQSAWTCICTCLSVCRVVFGTIVCGRIVESKAKRPLDEYSELVER